MCPFFGPVADGKTEEVSVDDALKDKKADLKGYKRYTHEINWSTSCVGLKLLVTKGFASELISLKLGMKEKLFYNLSWSPILICKFRSIEKDATGEAVKPTFFLCPGSCPLLLGSLVPPLPYLGLKRQTLDGLGCPIF